MLLVLNKEIIEVVKGVLHQHFKTLLSDNTLDQSNLKRTDFLWQHAVDGIGNLFPINTLDILLNVFHALLAESVCGANAIENEWQQRRLNLSLEGIALLFALEFGIQGDPTANRALVTAMPTSNIIQAF